MLNRLLGRKAVHAVHSELKKELLPKHVAIIMDGNGRWAKSKGLPRLAGHKKGTEALKTIIRYCSDIGLDYLTVYAFSTENWSRPKDEVDGLMELLVIFLKAEIQELHENNVRMKILGDITALPSAPRNEVESALELTARNTGLTLNIALNYGSRTELLRAIKKIATEAKEGNLDPEDIAEEDFSQYLYTAEVPDPDLLIRTSGEQRISNFLLWQLAYSELWFTDILWPEFTPAELDKALLDFQNRDRRYGKL